MRTPVFQPYFCSLSNYPGRRCLVQPEKTGGKGTVSEVFAHLECDFEFVEVLAEAVGVVGGAALSAGNGK